MKRRLIAGFLTLTMAITSAVSAFAADNVQITVDGLKQISTAETINIDGYNLLGMRDVFEMFGADVDWNKYKLEAKATKDDTTVVINLTDNTVKINDEYVETPVDCQMIDGTLYVPVRFVAEALDCKVDWDSQTNTVSIKNTNGGNYILLEPDSGIDENTTVYTYEEALELALKDSSDLETLEDSRDYLEDLRDDLGTSLRLLDLTESYLNTSVVDPNKTTDEILAFELSIQENMESFITVARSIQDVEMQRSMIDTNKEMVADSIEVSLISKLNSIKQLETQIALLSETIELGQENVEQLTLKNELGYTSDYDLESAINTQKTNESSLETLKLSLQTAKEGLNTFLGLSATDDVYVVYNEEMKSLDDFKLESFIARQRESAPTIKTLKNAVTLAEYTAKTNAAMTSELTSGVDNDLKSAGRALEDGKDALEDNIRSAYNSVLQLQEQDKALKVAVNQAISDYNSVVTSYQAGMATEYQVKQAKLGILSAEKAVDDNMLTYNTTVFMLETPYLLG